MAVKRYLLTLALETPIPWSHPWLPLNLLHIFCSPLDGLQDQRALLSTMQSSYHSSWGKSNHLTDKQTKKWPIATLVLLKDATTSSKAICIHL